jgi:hypothetical protein
MPLAELFVVLFVAISEFHYHDSTSINLRCLNVIQKNQYQRRVLFVSNNSPHCRQ